MDIDFRVFGPIFDGRARAAVNDYLDDVESEVADEGQQLVLAELGAVLQHPTGYYESQIGTRPDGGGWIVHDNNVIYGPWLAGVGSRNARSSFKGYKHWPQAAAALATRAGAVAERVLFKYIGRMNG